VESDVIDRHAPVYPIRTVGLQTGVKPGRIRAWERHGLLNPWRTHGGHRLFSEEDVDRIRRIRAMRGRGMRLKEVQRLLDSHPEVPRPSRERTTKSPARTRTNDRILRTTGRPQPVALPLGA
jgi:DNA-binding transcriptional MerR regulator